MPKESQDQHDKAPPAPKEESEPEPGELSQLSKQAFQCLVAQLAQRYRQANASRWPSSNPQSRPGEENKLGCERPAEALRPVGMVDYLHSRPAGTEQPSWARGFEQTNLAEVATQGMPSDYLKPRPVEAAKPSGQSQAATTPFLQYLRAEAAKVSDVFSACQCLCQAEAAKINTPPVHFQCFRPFDASRPGSSAGNKHFHSVDTSKPFFTGNQRFDLAKLSGPFDHTQYQPDQAAKPITPFDDMQIFRPVDATKANGLAGQPQPVQETKPSTPSEPQPPKPAQMTKLSTPSEPQQPLKLIKVAKINPPFDPPQPAQAAKPSGLLDHQPFQPAKPSSLSGYLQPLQPVRAAKPSGQPYPFQLAQPVLGIKASTPSDYSQPTRPVQAAKASTPPDHPSPSQPVQATMASIPPDHPLPSQPVQATKASAPSSHSQPTRPTPQPLVPAAPEPLSDSLCKALNALLLEQRRREEATDSMLKKMQEAIVQLKKENAALQQDVAALQKQQAESVAWSTLAHFNPSAASTKVSEEASEPKPAVDRKNDCGEGGVIYESEFSDYSEVDDE